ncbi:MAG: hypothetical protein V1870_03660 [Candidatus Aenigmatarchaeota archaeon]
MRANASNPLGRGGCHNILKKFRKEGSTNVFDESDITFMKKISESSVSDDVWRNIDESFWYDVKSTKMVEMFDEALTDIGIEKRSIKSIDDKLLDDTGFFKVVDKCTLTTTTGKKVEVVIKKGTISNKDIEVAREMAEYDITAKPYNKNLYKFDDKNVYIEEYVPGEKLNDAITNEAYPIGKMAYAMSELNTKITRFAKKGNIRYNSDIHGGNIKIYKDASGNIVAKIIDYDTRPLFYKDMAYNKYFFSTILKDIITLKNSPEINSKNYYNIYDHYFNGMRSEMMDIFGQDRGTKAFNTVMRKAESDFRLVGPDFNLENWMIGDDIFGIEANPNVPLTIRELPHQIKNYLPENAEIFTEPELIQLLDFP